MVAERIEKCRLEEIADYHSIGAGVFVPFTIARLAGGLDATEALLDVRIVDEPRTEESRRTLQLRWSPESIPRQELAVQERRLTELAACGVACVVVRQFAGIRIERAASEGECFDYWVSHEDRSYGLEVSGTSTEDVVARHREKVRQLRSNPHGIGGFVVVVGFATHEVVFSWHIP